MGSKLGISSIFGVTGTFGAGKGEFVNLLKINYGYSHFSVRDYIVEQLKQRGMPINRDTMTGLANELRFQHGGAYIISELVKKAQQEKATAIIIESIRTEAEVLFLKEIGASLIAVDATLKVRYSRIVERNSETDNVSFEEFQLQELCEYKNDDPSKQNISYCISQADIIFQNDGTLEEFKKDIHLAMNDYYAHGRF